MSANYCIFELILYVDLNLYFKLHVPIIKSGVRDIITAIFDFPRRFIC